MQLTKPKFPVDIEITIFKLNSQKIWLLVLVYELLTQSTPYFLDWLTQIVDFYGIALKKQTTEKVLI